MTGLDFSFGNAVSHFRKTGGPKGFLWKFMLAYAVLAIVVQGTSMFLMAPIFAAAFDPVALENPEVMDQVMLENIGRVMLGYLASFVLGILVWMMFEGASQRRYMRAEGFRIQIGADEGRLLVIGLIWMALFIGLYIGMFLVLVIPMGIGMAVGDAGMIIGPLLAFVLFFAYAIFCMWLAARFSPAAALTIRDRKISFGRAWRVTKGKAWTIIGSWVVLMLIMMAIIVVLYLLLAVTAVFALMPVMQGGPADDPGVVLAALASPAFLLPAILFALVYMMIVSAMMHVFGGPAALAARTDPDWVDDKGLDTTFA